MTFCCTWQSQLLLSTTPQQIFDLDLKFDLVLRPWPENKWKDKKKQLDVVLSPPAYDLKHNIIYCYKDLDITCYRNYTTVQCTLVVNFFLLNLFYVYIYFLVTFGILTDRPTGIPSELNCAPSSCMSLVNARGRLMDHLFSTQLHCEPPKCLSVQNCIMTLENSVPCEPPKFHMPCTTRVCAL